MARLQVRTSLAQGTAVAYATALNLVPAWPYMANWSNRLLKSPTDKWGEVKP